MNGFDVASVFNDDFSYFYADRIGPERTAEEAAILDALAEVGPTERVLDLCCGEGRITRHLAEVSVAAVGLDASLPYLEHATGTARADERVARFVCADARRLPFRSVFDVVVCWYTSFGYFDDETNRLALSELRRALRPGGRVLLDLNSKEHLLRSKLPTQMRERGDDLMVEQFRYDSDESRVLARRTVVRGEEVRRTSYFVRVFDEGELGSWLEDCGFVDVELFGDDGAGFRSGAKRMIARARRPPTPE